MLLTCSCRLAKRVVPCSKFGQTVLRSGFYQGGQSIAVECDVLFPNGTSVCMGGAGCVAQRLDLPVSEACNGLLGALALCIPQP